MKLFTKVLAILAVAAMLATTAFAAEFLPSAEIKDGPGYEGDDVVITPVGDLDDPDLSDDVRDPLEDALDDLKNSDLNELIDGFEGKWHSEMDNAPLDNASVSDLFHVQLNGNENNITITLDGEGKYIIIGRDPETGKWSILDYTTDGNKATINLDGDMTVAVIRDNGNPPKVEDPDKSPQTGVATMSVSLAAATVVLLAGAAVVLGKKRD